MDEFLYCLHDAFNVRADDVVLEYEPFKRMLSTNGVAKFPCAHVLQSSCSSGVAVRRCLRARMTRERFGLMKEHL